MSKFFSNEKDNVLSTFVELHYMLFHEYECSIDGTIRHECSMNGTIRRVCLIVHLTDMF